MDCPYPEPTPPCDSRRFLDALNGLGDQERFRYIGLIRVLHLFGKVDEVTEFIEKYNAYIGSYDSPLDISTMPPADNDMPPLVSEMSASSEDEFFEQLRAIPD